MSRTAGLSWYRPVFVGKRVVQGHELGPVVRIHGLLSRGVGTSVLLDGKTIPVAENGQFTIEFAPTAIYQNIELVVAHPGGAQERAYITIKISGLEQLLGPQVAPVASMGAVQPPVAVALPAAEAQAPNQIPNQIQVQAQPLARPPSASVPQSKSSVRAEAPVEPLSVEAAARIDKSSDSNSLNSLVWEVQGKIQPAGSRYVIAPFARITSFTDLASTASSYSVGTEWDTLFAGSLWKLRGYAWSPNSKAVVPSGSLNTKFELGKLHLQVTAQRHSLAETISADEFVPFLNGFGTMGVAVSGMPAAPNLLEGSGVLSTGGSAGYIYAGTGYASFSDANSRTNWIGGVGLTRPKLELSNGWDLDTVLHLDFYSSANKETNPQYFSPLSFQTTSTGFLFKLNHDAQQRAGVEISLMNQDFSSFGSQLGAFFSWDITDAVTLDARYKKMKVQAYSIEKFVLGLSREF